MVSSAVRLNRLKAFFLFFPTELLQLTSFDHLWRYSTSSGINFHWLNTLYVPGGFNVLIWISRLESPTDASASYESLT